MPRISIPLGHEHWQTNRHNRSCNTYFRQTRHGFRIDKPCHQIHVVLRPEYIPTKADMDYSSAFFCTPVSTKESWGNKLSGLLIFLQNITVLFLRTTLLLSQLLPFHRWHTIFLQIHQTYQWSILR
jgi:hypothetical protein